MWAPTRAASATMSVFKISGTPLTAVFMRTQKQKIWVAKAVMALEACMWKLGEAARNISSIPTEIWKSVFNVTSNKTREFIFNITTRSVLGASYAQIATILMARTFTAQRASG
jgi:hypothetical protein